MAYEGTPFPSTTRRMELLHDRNQRRVPTRVQGYWDSNGPLPGGRELSYFYNDPIPARTKQKAGPDDARAYAAQLWDTGYPFEPDRSCQDVLPPLLVYSGLYMHLYELDYGGSDVRTASMSYPTHSVPITCQSAWNCTGESVEGWTAPNSSTGQATADIRVTLETRRLQ